MTNRVRLYKIRVPFTLSEWRKGQRYILTQLTTAEVQIVYHRTRKEDKTQVTETHKILDVKGKVPYIIKKVIPEDACVVDEFSTNIEAVNVEVEGDEKVYKIETHLANNEGIIASLDANRTEVVDGKGKPIDNCAVNVKHMDFVGGEDETESLHSCTTSYKNRHFDESTFAMHVQTKVSKKDVANIFKLAEAPKEELIDFRTFNKKNIAKVGDREYSGNWTEKYDSVIIYKLVDVTINSFGFGWITKEIDKHVKAMLVDVQQKIVESYDQWKVLSEEELCNLEKEMIKRFLVKVQ